MFSIIAVSSNAFFHLKVREKNTSKSMETTSSAKTTTPSSKLSRDSSVSTETKDTIRSSSGSGAKIQVVNEREVKITGGSASSQLCINPSTMSVSIGEAAKPYEFRTGTIECRGSPPSVTSTSTVLDVVECSGNTLRVRCTEGKVITYGGYCEGPAIVILDTAFNTLSSTWSDLPTFESVRISCESTANVGKRLYVTCMREKQ